MIYRLDSKITLKEMMYLKKTFLAMLKLILPDVKKTKNDRKKMKENEKVRVIPKARDSSHVCDRILF